VPPEPDVRGASLRGWLEARFNLTEMFSFLTSFGLFPTELDTSRPLKEAIDESLSRPFPSYARWPRALGILSMLLFLFLGVTGVMLSLYYQPTVGDAYGSVTTLVRDVNFGSFVHHFHGWAARLLLLLLLVRAWRFYFQGMYKGPREALWIVSTLLFVTAAAADFTGRLLPWDQQGYWQSIRGMEILGALPLGGSVLLFFVGGGNPDTLMLLRFYFLHVVAFPLLMLILFYLNFSTVRRVGLSFSAGESRSGRGIFKVHLYNLLILTSVVFGLLVTLAILLPSPYRGAADPFNTPPGVRPPWYLLAPHAFLQSFPTLVPRWVRGLLLEAILAFCVLLPFLDRSPGRASSQRRLAILLGAGVLLIWLIFLWMGYRLEGTR
jgi:quinol-cytochrome oxidoreductase complex cytochrome b subunit